MYTLLLVGVLWTDFGLFVGIGFLLLAIRFAKVLAIFPMAIIGLWVWTVAPSAASSAAAFFKLRKIASQSEIFQVGIPIADRELAFSMEHTINRSLTALIVRDTESLLLNGDLDVAHLKMDQSFTVEGDGFLTFQTPKNASSCSDIETFYTALDFEKSIKRSSGKPHEFSVPARLVRSYSEKDLDSPCILIASTQTLERGILIVSRREISGKRLRKQIFTISDAKTGKILAVLYGGSFSNDFMPLFFGSVWNVGYFQPQSVWQQYLKLPGQRLENNHN